MSEQEMKPQNMYSLLHAKIKAKFLCLSSAKLRKKLQKKSFLKKRESGWLSKNRKESFLTALTQAIKK